MIDSVDKWILIGKKKVAVQILLVYKVFHASQYSSSYA